MTADEVVDAVVKLTQDWLRSRFEHDVVLRVVDQRDDSLVLEGDTPLGPFVASFWSLHAYTFPASVLLALLDQYLPGAELDVEIFLAGVEEGYWSEMGGIP